MKKNLIRIILLFLLLVPTNVYALEFKDINHGFWAYKEIDLLTDEGIISGYPDNEYLPQKLVTRAEYAAMVIKTIGQENIPIETMYTFEDIDNSHWAWGYILRAVNLDILKPASDSYFYPNDYITRSEEE